ncbi:hypothetical protein VARIO8X_150057 [Burkholderiales bacterium 8X]|nr:hypothetical protein VARIO8X_150057 [Burkholderiales bacterium 8X]
MRLVRCGTISGFPPLHPFIRGSAHGIGQQSHPRRQPGARPRNPHLPERRPGLQRDPRHHRQVEGQAERRDARSHRMAPAGLQWPAGRNRCAIPPQRLPDLRRGADPHAQVHRQGRRREVRDGHPGRPDADAGQPPGTGRARGGWRRRRWLRLGLGLGLGLRWRRSAPGGTSARRTAGSTGTVSGQVFVRLRRHGRRHSVLIASFVFELLQEAQGIQALRLFSLRLQI